MKRIYHEEEEIFSVKRVKQKDGDKWALKIDGNNCKLDPNWTATIMYNAYLKCVMKLDDCDQLPFEAAVKDKLKSLFKNGN